VNHLPFEDWLLNDMPVTPEQQRDLDLHLRTCTYCSALAETGRMLSTSKMAEPTSGFTARFQTRLAQQKVLERRRKLWGMVLFIFGGAALLMWAVSPYLTSFLSSPATWISVSVFPNVLPPFAWLVLFSTIAGAGLLWSVSIWRFVRTLQGV